ncbi:hypothetical protein, partial [[Clostridium] innocuum]|uniref:hypothetical protein n=1 Tax=Clostridium innocuum TaxID=1522 RepID=UPI001E2C85B4
ITITLPHILHQNDLHLNTLLIVQIIEQVGTNIFNTNYKLVTKSAQQLALTNKYKFYKVGP